MSSGSLEIKGQLHIFVHWIYGISQRCMKYMYLGTKLIIWKLSFSHLDALLMLSTGKMHLSVFVFHRIHTDGGRHLLSSSAPHNLHLDCPSIIRGKSKKCRIVFPARDRGRFRHQIFLKHPRISRSNRPERRMSSSFSSVPKHKEGQPESSETSADI